MGADDRLAELGIVLPEGGNAAGTYLSAVRTGNLLFLAGHGPITAEGDVIVGKVGEDLDIAEGNEAARAVGLQLLATLRRELGSLDEVVRIVKVLVMVNCAPGFNQMPAVADGCSDLFVEVFGDAGRHARSAVGLAELPFDIAVEIELVAEVR